ncbi:MAG: hypothetical protein RR921_06510 [Mucinivorans sp.]
MSPKKIATRPANYIVRGPLVYVAVAEVAEWRTHNALQIPKT